VVPAACGIITVANVGGFVGPYAMGFLTDLTGSQFGGVMVMVVSAAMAGVCIWVLPRGRESLRESVAATKKY
jgi:nitrate/nitrite transporter NarK